MDQSLAALVIHDLKNSLALLEAELEILARQPGVPDEAYKAHQRCADLKQRLIGFLTLYKQEQGSLRPNLSATELPEFLEDVLAASPSANCKHGHALDVHLDSARTCCAPEVPHRGTALLDEYLVELALESALNNALRFAASKVRLWFEQTADTVSFCVQDDGPGLSHHPAGMPPSTGVGLALCRAVIEAHGGGAVTLNDAPEGGALFRLTLHCA